MSRAPHESCLACGSTEIATCLDLGRQQPANLLTQSKDESVKEYPLGLVRCRACGHGQLLHMVSPDLLFNRYLYKSGTSGTLRAYFQWFFEQTSTLLPANGRVLEIAANDGSLLTKFTEAGFESIGIDPAANIVEAGEWGPLRMVCDFFPSETIAGEEFELVLGLNVLAHTPDPLGLLRAVSEQLTEDGIAIFQTSQATMLTHGEFDTIYHEHYSFFTPQSLTMLAERAGLCVRRIDLTDIHGTSFAFVLSSNPDASLPDGLFRSGKFAIETARSKTILETFEGDVNELYEAFVDTAVERMAEVRELVAAKKASGHAVVMVGVAAKAITFARAAGLELDLAFDEAPEKIGLFIPGLGLQIKDLEEVRELRGQTMFVLTAWNFASELERKVRAQVTQCEPEFLTYFPEVRAW